MGSKGATGFIGKQGPPGKNAECILGETSENRIGMQGYVCGYSTWKYVCIIRTLSCVLRICKTKHKAHG